MNDKAIKRGKGTTSKSTSARDYISMRMGDAADVVHKALSTTRSGTSRGKNLHKIDAMLKGGIQRDAPNITITRLQDEA